MLQQAYLPIVLHSFPSDPSLLFGLRVCAACLLCSCIECKSSNHASHVWLAYTLYSVYDSAARANISHMHYQFMASINIKFINSQGVVAHHLQRILSGAAAATAAATTATTATATLFGQINNEKEK